MTYMNTVMNGEEKEKLAMSFKLIDIEGRGFFEKKDLSSMIKSIVSSWGTLMQVSVCK